jgi:hypothetical protein
MPPHGAFWDYPRYASVVHGLGSFLSSDWARCHMGIGMAKNQPNPLPVRILPKPLRLGRRHSHSRHHFLQSLDLFPLELQSTEATPPLRSASPLLPVHLLFTLACVGGAHDGRRSWQDAVVILLGQSMKTSPSLGIQVSFFSFPNPEHPLSQDRHHVFFVLMLSDCSFVRVYRSCLCKCLHANSQILLMEDDHVCASSFV